MQPKSVTKSSKEYDALLLAATALKFNHPSYMFIVQDVYFDFGQDWVWTTIICYNGDDSYQILSPRDWELLVTATTAKEVVDVIETIEIVYDKYR